jgi:hypothetical protein
MIKMYLPTIVTSVVLLVTPIFAQAPRNDVATKSDITYGRVKDITPGQKVIVDVNNAPDKTYDVNDKSSSVHIASGLKVGDPVKITETQQNGKKMFDVMRDSEAGVQHGDKTKSEEQRR